MISVILLYAILASAFTIGKAVLYYTAQPIFFVALRMTLAGFLLLGFLAIFQRKSLKFSYSDIWILLQLAIFHSYFAFVLEFWALQNVSSSKASLLYNLSPFITALLVYVLMHEKLTYKKMFGLSLGMLGMLPELIVAAPEENRLFSFLSLEEVVIFLAVVSAAYGWILLGSVVNKYRFSPIAANGYAMLVGGLMAWFTSLFFEGSPQIIGQDHPTVIWGRELFAGILSQHFADVTMFVIYLAALILVSNVIFYNFYGYLLKKYSATFLSFAGFTCPLFTALYGWLFLSESVSVWFFASVATVFLGLYIFYQEELKQGVRAHT